MFRNDYQPIKRYLLAIDNRWKRAKEDKVVFDHYAHKKPKDEPFSEFMGTSNILFFHNK